MKIIVFGEDWGQHPSSTQHLFKIIGQQQEVYWFNSIGLRTPKCSFKDVKRVWQKLKMMITSTTETPNSQCPDKLKVLNPKLLPWHLNRFACRYNSQLVEKAIAPIPNEPVTYWLSLPTAIRLIKPRPIDKVIYYCGDDFTGLSGVDHEMARITELELISRADHILVASTNLLKKMPPEKTQLLEHGVDYELFSQTVPKHPNFPNQKVVLGFYGSLCDWLDKDLLLHLVRQRRQYQLLLIGELRTDLEALLAEPNVLHLDAVPHQQLPQFSQHWQVALLPFVNNKQIQACNPLKLKEYLACGQPIVATQFPAVSQYKQWVMVADDKQGFLKRVDYAVSLSQVSGLNWQHVSQQQVAPHGWSSKVKFIQQAFSI